MAQTVTKNAGIARRMDNVTISMAPVWMGVIQGIMEPIVQKVNYALIILTIFNTQYISKKTNITYNDIYSKIKKNLTKSVTEWFPIPKLKCLKIKKNKS